MDLVFDLCGKAQNTPKNRGCPRTRYINRLECPIQLYVSTWVVEEVEENVGGSLEARGCQKSSKKVKVGNQAGNHLGDQLPTCFPLLRPVYFLQIDQEDRLVSIVMMYVHRGFPFTKVQLYKLAYQIAISEKKTGFSPPKKRAGRIWLKYFYKRQPDLKKKVVGNLSIGRAMAANPECIEKFF